MNEERIAAKAFSRLDQFLEGALDEELKATIRKRAIVGGLCMAIPLWGLETIIYIIALWGTYVRIAKISTVPFRDHLMKNIGGAVTINIIVSVITGLILDSLFGVGWVLSFFIGFASVSVSGMAYIKALKALHGQKSKTDIDIKQGFASMMNSSDLSEQTAGYLNKVGEYTDIPSELNQSYGFSTRNNSAVDNQAIENITGSINDRLKHLRELWNNGVLSKEEYEKERRKVFFS